MYKILFPNLGFFLHKYFIKPLFLKILNLK